MGASGNDNMDGASNASVSNDDDASMSARVQAKEEPLEETDVFIANIISPLTSPVKEHRPMDKMTDTKDASNGSGIEQWLRKSRTRPIIKHPVTQSDRSTQMTRIAAQDAEKDMR